MVTIYTVLWIKLLQYLKLSDNGGNFLDIAVLFVNMKRKNADRLNRNNIISE